MRAFLVAMVVFCVAHTASADPILLFLPGEPAPGGSFEVRFRFDGPPTNAEGAADALVVNGGSLSRGLLFSWVDLYADDGLLSIFQGMTNRFGVFTEPGADFSVWRNATALDQIWSGALGRIVFRP